MAKSHEEQKLRQLEYQHFDLIKVKITKDGADVTHHESGNDAGQLTKIGEVQPHPDLQASLDELAPFMAQRIGILDGWDFSREHTKKDLEVLKMAMDGHKEAISRCNVNGITFLGDGETYGVMITGSLKLPKGGSIGMAVSKITFGKDVLGYETEVEEICEKIKKEVYAYRFQSKKLQLDIETELKKKENPDLFKEPKTEKDETKLK